MGSSASKDNAPVVENMEEVNQEVDTFTFEDSSDLVEETEVSSEEDEDEEMMERLRVLDDARKLKQLAEAFLYPERPVVTTDPCVCGRNFFERASALQVEEDIDEEERNLILGDMAALKQLAVEYLHPEVDVVTSDDTACARNYYERPSAVQQESVEDAEERAGIMQDLQALKQFAVDYTHPELGVATTDPTAHGRNYFDRFMALDSEQAEECSNIMKDLQAFKRLATDYLHTEIPVVTTDSIACARNYFDRASAPKAQSMEEVEESARIMEDTAVLKTLAVDYLHPEQSVVVDPRVCGRNYFDRAPAPQQEMEVEEYDHIMNDLQVLKKLAADYLRPELPVIAADPCACGRNYYGRASALEVEYLEVGEDQALIIEESMILQQLAVEYLHPELPVVTSDPCSCGRNYFDRASSHEQETEEQTEERTLIMEDLQSLNKFAVEYGHPEYHVVSTDCTCCGRNYFGRFSSSEQTCREEAEELTRAMEDAVALKKFAVDYFHPELPVVTTEATAGGRNYYDRASAKGHNYISTTREDSFKIIDEEESYYLDECDLHYGNFDMDEEMVCDMKYQLHNLLEHCHDHLDHHEVAPVNDKGDEGKLSRSPSSVMLFGGFEAVA